MIEAAALAALLLGAALASCQQPGPSPPKTEKTPDVKVPDVKDQPDKSKLEEMIEKALKDNPDLRLAQAKLAEAEAELNRARLLVAQNVAVQYHAVEAQKAAVQSAISELKRMKQLGATGAVQTTIVDIAEQKLIDAKAKLASLEAELPYLLGQQAEGKIDAKLRTWLESKGLPQPADGAAADYDKYRTEYIRHYYLDLYGRLPTAEEAAAAALPKPGIQGPTADRIRAALDKPFTLDAKELSLEELIAALDKAFQEANSGLLIKNNTDSGIVHVPVRFDRMPFGAVLEWIEDTVPDCRVVVRDYGIVIALKDQLPPGAPSLRDFWKGGKGEDKAPAKESSNNAK